MSDSFSPLGTISQTKRIPVSSFMRMWSLGTSQARIAGHFFNYAIRKQFADDGDKQALQNEFHLKSAQQLLGTMGYLRGAIMKSGQMLANFPQLMPQELIEVFESLQFEAPPMHFSLIREVFLDEFGKDPNELFAFFDKHAFAAASLGQLHRARLFNGKEVAVKVQYPNIAATIEADMRTLALLLQSIRFKKEYKYLCAHVLDAKEVFLQEVDYLSEAFFMEKNRKLFSGSQIVVPEQYPEVSSRRILTMEYLPGQHLQEFLARNPSSRERNHFAELISYSLVRSWFQHRTVYSDIHPGNFILMKDGRLGFIDFGCCRQFNQERWQDEITGEIGMIENDREKVLHFLTKLTMNDSPEDLDPQLISLMTKQIQWMIAPIMAKGSFDFAEREYVDSGTKLLKEFIKKGLARTDPFYNWTNRAILGHRAIMYRLQANFDYSSLYLKEMEKHL
jgi:aarF domain-containing kinase